MKERLKINHDSDEKIISHVLNQIQTPQFDIVGAVERRIKPSKSIYTRRRILIPLVACLLFILSFGVAAAKIEVLNNLVSIVSPQVALMLQPINITSEDRGIKMEVVAAMNDDEMAVIYITLQDLIGNRINETLDIYDFSLSGASIFNSQVVHYDEKTKTATLRIQANGGKDLNGRKVTFEIRSFLSDKQEFEAIDLGFNLVDIKESKPTKTKPKSTESIPLDLNNSISGGSGINFEQYQAKGTINVLKTDETDLPLPNIDFVKISNMGFMDDGFHIQVKWIGGGIDDHGYFYLVDSNGNKILNDANVRFGTDELGRTQWGREYEEYIFEVNDRELQDLKLMGYFVTNGNYTTGKWKSTFKIESVGSEKSKDCNIKTDEWTVKNISISPLGVTLEGNIEKDKDDGGAMTVTVNMKDGDVQVFESTQGLQQDQKFIVKFVAPMPIDPSQVKSVTVEGKEIYFD